MKMQGGPTWGALPAGRAGRAQQRSAVNGGAKHVSPEASSQQSEYLSPRGGAARKVREMLLTPLGGLGKFCGTSETLLILGAAP